MISSHVHPNCVSGGLRPERSSTGPSPSQCLASCSQPGAGVHNPALGARVLAIDRPSADSIQRDRLRGLHPFFLKRAFPRCRNVLSSLVGAESPEGWRLCCIEVHCRTWVRGGGSDIRNLSAISAISPNFRIFPPFSTTLPHFFWKASNIDCPPSAWVQFFLTSPVIENCPQNPREIFSRHHQASFSPSRPGSVIRLVLTDLSNLPPPPPWKMSSPGNCSLPSALCTC